MAIQLHGFDWVVYAEHVMPAFAQWLIYGEDTAVHELFEQTRCTREEQFLPDPMQQLRVWPRAQAFVEKLPRGPHSRREYSKLCSADHYTALSDRYLYKHAPQLYANSDAVRAVWGAIVEEYCLPWTSTGHEMRTEQEGEAKDEVNVGEGNAGQSEHVVRSELVSLLHAAGLNELAKEVGEQTTQVERFEWEPGEPAEADELVTEEGQEKEQEQGADEEGEIAEIMPRGIAIGHQTNTLHLRGWLAGISVRAMALFEYLACGRRSMPFGYEAAEPFGAFIGYLTPDEVWQLVTCLHDVKPPDEADAVEDYLNFRFQQQGLPDSFRLVDEVLPSHAVEFLKAVRTAAFQGLGLICSVE